jgi:hypothetical protein
VDVLKIVGGTLMREQKFYHSIQVFTKSNEGNVDKLTTCCKEKRLFNPQVLTTTSSTTNAGIDDPEVYGICQMDFLPSLMDVKQEKGSFFVDCFLSVVCSLVILRFL